MNVALPDMDYFLSMGNLRNLHNFGKAFEKMIV